MKKTLAAWHIPAQLFGVAMLFAGLYLAFGLDWALIAGGAFALTVGALREGGRI